MLTVEPGDSVGGIAQRYGVTATAIIVLNELSHPYWLHTGQRLAVPRAGYAVARRDEPPADASRYANGEPAMVVAAIEVEPAAPARVEPEHPAPVVQAEPEESVPTIQAEPAAPEPPRSRATRLARAEPEATPPRPTLYALARQPESDRVPLPPTRNTFLWPVEGSVISGFGAKPGGKHNDGINIAAPVGSAVRAAQTGVVAYAGNELRGYGNLVLIRHDGGWMTAYAHNDALLVGKGDVVRRGQVISHSGRSGGVSRPQAHFEIRHDGEPQDPLRLLTRK
ncbi:MAG: M23 family metallopeptidase [Rhodospirillaceae bacterium]|nr:M23 family metallopeptidase [Rhodospirillaceae bacterium]